MLRLTVLLLASLTFTACDSDTPTPDADLDGTYVGRWADQGGTFDLALDLTTEQGRLTGDATVSFTMNGTPLTSSHALTGVVNGEQVRFSLPFRHGLNFSGTAAANNAAVQGTVFRAVPGQSPSGLVDVEAPLRLTRSE